MSEQVKIEQEQKSNVSAKDNILLEVKNLKKSTIQ